MQKFKILLSTKFKLLPPKKNKILIFDNNLYYKYKILDFIKKDHGILHTRFEVINIFILIKIFLKFRFSFFDYLQEYVDYVNQGY